MDDNDKNVREMEGTHGQWKTFKCNGWHSSATEGTQVQFSAFKDNRRDSKAIDEIRDD